jgi:hypothetical protein
MDKAKACLRFKKETPVAFSAMENVEVWDSQVGPEYSLIECSKYLEDSNEYLRLPPRVSDKVSQRLRNMVLTQ